VASSATATAAVAAGGAVHGILVAIVAFTASNLVAAIAAAGWRSAEDGSN
jgi:hypothetical protein